MLQHEVMIMGEWNKNGPQHLVTVSLCIQYAIDRMYLCSLSITYACPYHNPTANMGHSIHNTDISKLFTSVVPECILLNDKRKPVHILGKRELNISY